jgi:spore maturation protein CgeB
LLVIDYGKDLHLLFEPGKEVETCGTPNECSELINYYLDYEDERKSIAVARQKRTQKEHTFYHRVQGLLEIVRRYLNRGQRRFE